MQFRRPRFKTYTQADYTDTLYQAVLAARHDAVESLLDGGVNPNCLRGALSPLHVAITMQDARMTKLLLSFRADPNAFCTTQNITPLMLAAAEGHPVLCGLLIDAGAHLDALNEHGLSALMIAVGEGHTAITSMLVAAGADIFLRNKRDQIAYDVAVTRGNSECAAVLYATMCLPRLHRPRTLRAPKAAFWRKK